MRKIYIIIVLFYHVFSAFAQSLACGDTAPKHEVRAVWLTTIGGLDWPHSYSQSPRSAEKQRQELRHILDRLEAAHVNTILLQTRVRATTIYPSDYEPWDGCLSGFPGKGPGYDALQFAIDECHRRGMELHAWVVTIPVGRWNATGCQQLRRRYPGLVRKIDAEGYMNPEDSRTADYLARICREITRRYDIDGIHLDYIRYPETWKLKVGREQGRRYITRIVERIHDAVKGEKPWVKMSCSPIGKFDDLSRYWSHGWNAYAKVCQDAQGWLRDGLMDQLYPMMYFRGDQFYPFAIDWAEQSGGKTVAPGLGIYFLDPKEGKWSIGDVTGEMRHLRNLGLGQAFFRCKFLLDNHQGIYDFTARFDAYPSLVPPMTWASQRQPAAPTSLRLTPGQGCSTLAWTNPETYTDGTPIATPHIYNNVYASRTYPVDVSDARNLIRGRNMGGSITLKDADDGQPLYFAVTAVDGYGNESRETQLSDSPQPARSPLYGAANVLKCDGIHLQLPKKPKYLDADVILIESLTGQAVRTFPYSSNTLDISRLNDGIYLVKSLGRKGVSHTLGTFRKKIFQKK